MTTPAAIAALRSESVARRGLTLIELMVVMVILTILSSLMLAGLLVARERSRQVKTLSTIRKLSEAILPYYEEYETRRPILDDQSLSRILADGTKANRELVTRYKRIALRRLMALELPDQASDVTGTFDGVLNPKVFDPKVDGQSTPLTEIPPATRRYAALMGSKAVDTADSDLLHLIVTRGVVADPDMIAHFRDDEVADTNGNGLKEFVDGWGRPIRFWRWPVGLASPLQQFTGSLSDIDPLVSETGHRLVPLIYSAGRDAQEGITRPPLGLNYEPFGGTVPSPIGPGFADNIHNHDLRL